MPRKQFTIIELMIVVSVIALLCSLLLPALNHAKESAKRIKCAGNLKQLGVAAEMYSIDYDGWCITSGYRYNGKSIYWNGLLVRELKYLQNSWRAAICPLNTNVLDGDWDSGYGLNGSTFGYSIYASSPPINTNFAKTSIIANYGTASSLIYITESVFGTAANPNYSGFAVWRYYPPYVHLPGDTSASSIACTVDLRHSFSANAVIFDGHVENFSNIPNLTNRIHWNPIQHYGTGTFETQ